MKDTIATEIIRRPIKGWPGYLVDNVGEIWSRRREKKLNRRSVNIHISGYKYVFLYRKNRMRGRGYFKVSRLVAQAFVPNPQNKPYVCHKNGIRTDNRAENLYWGTAKENSRDSILHGTHIRFKKLNEAKVKLIRLLVGLFGWTHKKTADFFGVKLATVSKIVQGKNWVYIP